MVLALGHRMEIPNREPETVGLLTHRIWIICRLHTLSVEEEAHTLRGLALPIAKRIHQLLQLGSAFDLEEHLVVIIRNFDIEMLRLLSSILGLVHVVWRTVVRHVEGGFGVLNTGSQVCL